MKITEAVYQRKGARRFDVTGEDNNGQPYASVAVVGDDFPDVVTVASQGSRMPPIHEITQAVLAYINQS